MIVARRSIRLNEHQQRHASDVERIQRVALSHGVLLGWMDAYSLWDNHSDSYAAGWLFLPDNDDELWNTIKYEIQDTPNGEA